MEDERRRILELLGRGQISAEDAERLLRALGGREEEPALGPEMRDGGEGERTANVDEARTAGEEAPQTWRRFWMWPLVAGGVVFVLGLTIMVLARAAGSMLAWTVCGLPPTMLGLLAMVLAVWSRTATWLHLRISERGSRTMVISLPLPLTLAGWVLRIVGPYVPQLKDTGVDELILALRDSKGRREPLFIDVQDEEDGEHVQIYIG